MSGEKLVVSKACFCEVLHLNCDATGCDQQRRAPKEGHRETFEGLERNAVSGCKLCAILLNGLTLPHISDVWKASREQAIKAGRARKGSAGEAIMIEVLPLRSTESRIVIRTLASSTSHEWRHFNFNLLSSATDSACKPFPVLRKFPVDRTDSKESYQQLKSWIAVCDQDHQCAPQSPPRLPKRVLKISETRVVLHLTRHDEYARYTTLSHTWGSNTSYVLTKHNCRELTEGIAWSSIPRTFQDAIKISRELGVDYLWIDCLCIIQGDEDDWNEQSREMSTVYGNSWLNIAATDSKDSHGGCFREGSANERLPLQKLPGNPNIVVMQQPVHTHKDFGSNYGADRWSPPLLQRGWVFQERLLSPRVVYYAKDELLWECKEMSDCQCGAITVVARYKMYYHLSLKKGDPLPFAWTKIAERYSSLKFTEDKDRLIALAGVVKEALNSNKAGRYLAGHWEQDLATHLCWTVVDTWRRPGHYLAPSWSWLSVFGKLQFSEYEFGSWKPSEIDIHIINATCLGSIPDGIDSITLGEIVLSGRILNVEAETLHAPQNDLAQYKLLHRSSKFEYASFKPDYIMRPKEATDIEKVSILFWGNIWASDGFRSTFMVLRVAQDRPAAYQRLGIFSITKETQSAKALVDACELMENICIV